VRCSEFDAQTLMYTTSANKDLKVWDITTTFDSPDNKPELLGIVDHTATCLSFEPHPRVA
jgi:hypothetical protein